MGGSAPLTAGWVCRAGDNHRSYVQPAFEEAGFVMTEMNDWDILWNIMPQHRVAVLPCIASCAHFSKGFSKG